MVEITWIVSLKSKGEKTSKYYYLYRPSYYFILARSELHLVVLKEHRADDVLSCWRWR